MYLFRRIALISATTCLLCSCESNAPPVILAQEFEIWEDWGHYYWDPVVEAYDPDGDQNLSFSIIDGNEEGIFAIYPATGKLTVLKSELLDYEVKPVHLLKVSVSDNHKKHPLEASAYIRIKVLENEEFMDGLVAYYDFNEGASDQSPNQQHGIVNGARMTGGRDEDSRNALFLDGIDDYIRFPDLGLFSYPKGHLSISLWVQALEHRDTTYLLCKGAGEHDREYALGINSDSLFFFRVHERGKPEVYCEAVSSTRVNYSDWYQVSGAWDGHMIHICVNGERESSRYGEVTAGAYGSDLYAGAAGPGITETSLQGAMDDLIIFHRDLTQSDIIRLFEWPYTEWFAK